MINYFVDVSGVGNSGKSAVVDLLREVDGVFVPEYWFEFDLIRVRGGLLDLRHHLLEDWSPIRSHAAYHEFIDIVKKMGCDPAPWNISGLLRSTGQRYDKRFCGQFQELSIEFAKKLEIGSYQALWPFDDLREIALLRFVKKIMRRAGLRGSLTREVLLLDGRDFDTLARSYLKQLYELIVPLGCDKVVLNNGLEPFNPKPGLDMLGARQIVVFRDPRDVFVSGGNDSSTNEGDRKLFAPDNDGINKSFLAKNNLPMFVERYRLFRERCFKGNSEDVLHLNFESLVMNSEKYAEIILSFLDINYSRRTKKNNYFRPDDSRKSIGLWRQYSNQDEIRYIETELKEYLFMADPC